MKIFHRSLPVRQEKQLEDVQADTANLQAAQSDTDSMAVDADYRLTLLELGLTDIDTSNT